MNVYTSKDFLGLEKLLVNSLKNHGYNIIRNYKKNNIELAILYGYSEVEDIIEIYPNIKIIVIDFHMLWNIEGNENIIYIINKYNVTILSCFSKFKYLYKNYGINIQKIKFINYVLNKNPTGRFLDKKSKNFILIPGKHRRDYELLFNTIEYLENQNYYMHYKIIDTDITEDYLKEIIAIKSIKSNIEFIKGMKYKEFLRELSISKIVVLPLQNIRHVCNGLTFFATCMFLGKLMITNYNLTTSPFVVNGYNCLCGKSNPEELANLIKLAVENQNLVNKIGKNALEYAEKNFSFTNLWIEIDKIING